MPPRTRTRTSSTLQAPARPSRPQAITNLQDPSAPGFRKWCVYGEVDAGKTVLLGSAPNALILSTDVEGTESAKALGSTADQLPINTFTEFVDAVDWLVLGKGFANYEWIGVDTIDELENLCWIEQLVSEDLKRASKYQPNKGDYPVVWAKVREQLGRLGRSPVNTLFTTHPMRIDRETEDGEDTVTLAMPAIGSRKRGDESTRLMSQLGMVGYLRVVTEEGGKSTRQLMTQSSNRWLARDRSTRLGIGMVEPTVPKLLAKMTGEAARPRTATRRRAR